MKVKIQVVRWEISPEIPLDDFCKYIKAKAGAESGCKLESAIVFKAWPRFVFLNERGDYWIILMMTLKAQRGSIVVDASADGVLKFISVNPDENASKVAEFNYLLLNKKTGIGVYSNYQGAMRFDKFTSFFRGLYDGLKTERIDAAVAAGMKLDDARKKFKGRFGAAALLTKASASALVQELRQIDHVSLSFDSLGSDGGFLSPYRDLARSSLHVIRFDQKTGITKIREAIVTTITSTPGVKGSVHGIHKDGLEKLVHLRTNLGVIDEFEHGDAIRAWEFEPEKLADGAVVKRMMKVVNVDPARFVTVVKAKKPLPEVGKPDDALDDEDD